MELWDHMVTRLQKGSEGHTTGCFSPSGQSVNETGWHTFVSTEKSMTGDWFLEPMKLNTEETSQ